jgi:hypothetical protein
VDDFVVLDSTQAAVTGLVQGNFTVSLWNPSGSEVSGSIPVTITEVGEGGYEVTFTPNVAGVWLLKIAHATHFSYGKWQNYVISTSTTTGVELVDHFVVLDSSLAPVTGLSQGNFTVKLWDPTRAEVSGTVSVTITEVGGGGYKAAFTPNSLGTWMLKVSHATYFSFGVWENYVTLATVGDAPVIASVVATPTTVTATLSGTAGKTYRVRLCAQDGTEEDEQQRTGPGDVVLTPSDTGVKVLMAWSVANGDERSEPSNPALSFVLQSGSLTYDAIHGIINAYLNLVQATNVAYENAEYEPESGTGYLRETLLPAEPEQAELGTDGRNRLTGIYQISVFEEVGKGSGDAETKAETLIAAFKRGTTLTANGLTVRIDKAWRSPAIQEKDWYHVPVSVRWFAYAAN